MPRKGQNQGLTLSQVIWPWKGKWQDLNLDPQSLESGQVVPQPCPPDARA